MGNVCPNDIMEEKRKLNDKFMLRLPDGMRERIKAEAAKNGRSMNTEIIATLEEKYPSEAAIAQMIAEQMAQFKAMDPQEREKYLETFVLGLKAIEEGADGPGTALLLAKMSEIQSK